MNYIRQNLVCKYLKFRAGAYVGTPYRSNARAILLEQNCSELHSRFCSYRTPYRHIRLAISFSSAPMASA